MLVKELHSKKFGHRCSNHAHIVVEYLRYGSHHFPIHVNRMRIADGSSAAFRADKTEPKEVRRLQKVVYVSNAGQCSRLGRAGHSGPLARVPPLARVVGHSSVIKAYHWPAE